MSVTSSHLPVRWVEWFCLQVAMGVCKPRGSADPWVPALSWRQTSIQNFRMEKSHKMKAEKQSWERKILYGAFKTSSVLRLPYRIGSSRTKWSLGRNSFSIRELAPLINLCLYLHFFPSKRLDSSKFPDLLSNSRSIWLQQHTTLKWQSSSKFHLWILPFCCWAS